MRLSRIDAICVLFMNFIVASVSINLHSKIEVGMKFISVDATRKFKTVHKYLLPGAHEGKERTSRIYRKIKSLAQISCTSLNIQT